MKIWRRIISAMLLLLICANAMALEETSEFTSFDAQITNGMDKSTTEWFSSSFNRALATTCLIVDLKLKIGDDLDFYEMLTSPTYVGKSDFMLIVIGKNDDAMITIAYSPINNEGNYMIKTFENFSAAQYKTGAEYVLSQIGDGQYYENDLSEIETCVSLFAKALED